MSANWAQIATVLCLNLCSFFSQFSFLLGDAAQTMTYFDYMALALASIALWTYNLEKEQIPTPVDPRDGSVEGNLTSLHLHKSSLGLLTASMVADGPAGKGLLTNSFQAGGGSSVRLGLGVERGASDRKLMALS